MKLFIYILLWYRRIHEKGSGDVVSVFVTLYTLSIYPSAHTNSWDDIGETFSWIPLYDELVSFFNIFYRFLDHNFCLDFQFSSKIVLPSTWWWIKGIHLSLPWYVTCYWNNISVFKTFMSIRLSDYFLM